MRVGGGVGGQRWQETNKQNEKHQLPEAYTLRTDTRHAFRLTPEPAALSVAGPFALFVASLVSKIRVIVGTFTFVLYVLTHGSCVSLYFRFPFPASRFTLECPEIEKTLGWNHNHMFLQS
jgi:hypothetical protein